MGKEKQEEICFENLRSKIGGKYATKKLSDFRKARKIDNWDDSPDFIAEIDGRILAVEHFTIDQMYVGNRSAKRMSDESLVSTYNEHGGNNEITGGNFEWNYYTELCYA